jgi:capsule polysaccharide export protein KpsE/RkpR
MTESARNNRQFIEDRLTIIKKDLSNCEIELNVFQKKYSLVDIESQTKATIEALAAVEAQFIDTKQKLQTAKSIYNYNNPEIKQLELEVKTIQQQITDFSKKKISEVFIPLDTAPDLGLEFVKLKRNLLVQEKIYEFAVQQYEAAKLEEAKQTPNLLVLDSARIPDKRFKPKRTYLLIISLALNSAFCFSLILLIEYASYLRKNNYELYAKIVNLFNLAKK